MTARLTYPSIFILSFAIFFLLHITFLSKNYRTSTEDVIIKITRGENLRTVAVKLEDNRIIFSKYFFIGLGKIFGYQTNIIPGHYSFPNGLSNIEILKLITDASVVRTIVVTIPEGLNIRQMGRLLQRQIGIDSTRFVEETKNDSLIKTLGISAVNLEGYLFPDTYRISFGGPSSEKEIIRILLAEFRKRITPDIKDGMKKKKLTLNELITMASIIEAETKYEAEKKTIAGVYYNRLKKRLRLEADPTVQYVLPDGPKKRLMYSDLKYPSPYNTYLNRGLPPGPINNPGLSSILAALYPEEHSYLYFAAKGDGSHRFAKTYEEHKKNAELYRQYLDQLEKEKGNK
ncbi:MAG TPA: endolytic transglycosylase MltG [Ignavibacteria bacterium]|jgi:UPF0755 protein